MGMMMEDEEMMEMVDDDQIENVGIMSGFMDDIEELMAEISEEEMNGMEEGDDADMARMMNRTPDSPEILMNNLRGDMRSIDARREELADLVGMREAEETPEGVLALLQPVLAQQDAVAAMPMPMPAPPMPAPPMPPMPAQPTGIETISVDETVVPAMYKGGAVQNFNRGSGQMGVTPAQSMSPSGVRYYANGIPEEESEMGVVSGGRFSPAAVTSADQYISTLLGAQPSATALSLPTMMKEEAELYKTLGLGTPKEDVQSQILFDIAQAALQYGSNVGPDGKPMAGSQAAKLGQIGGPLAGRVGARAGEMSKDANALKMFALQSAQGKIATAQAADIALAKQQGDLAVEIAKQDPAARMLTDVEVTEMGLDSDAGTWFVDGKGVPKLAGGREPKGDVFNLGDGSALTPGQKKMDEAFAPIYLEWVSGGGPDMGSQMASLATVARELEDGNTNLTGLDVGLLPDVVNYYINPGAIDARDNVEAVVQRNLRLILGAQFTEREGVRLIARAYNPLLEEEDNAVRVRRLLMQMTTAASQKQAMADYFSENGTLSGWAGTMPSIADFEKAIDGLPGYTVADIVGDANRGAAILGEDGVQD